MTMPVCGKFHLKIMGSVTINKVGFGNVLNCLQIKRELEIIVYQLEGRKMQERHYTEKEKQEWL